MGESCLLTTHVRNPKGQLVESRLFNDLLSYLPWSSAKEYYGVGTNKDFLRDVRKQAKFDENGEITFNSLRKLAKINISEEKLLDKLNKDLGAGIMSYDKAIVKLQDFNKNSQYNEDYMAIIERNNGQYNLRVIKRTAKNMVKLQDTIEKQELMNNILSKLRSYGVDTNFITEGPSRYSTDNVEQMANGLYGLISISIGENADTDLAEEAGHFAVGALGRSPLVTRLLNILDEKTQKELLGDSYYTKSLGTNPRREVAGTLVGQAIYRQLSNTTPWEKLANRIADVAKSIFAKFSGDDVRIAKVKAKKAANAIANNFLSDNFKGSIENVLSYRETLYNANLPYTVSVYKNSVEALGAMAKELEAISADDLSGVMTAILGQAIDGRSDVISNPGFDAELVSFQGLCQILSDISDLLGPGKEIDNLIESVDVDNITNFNEKMAAHGESLRKARAFLKNALILADILQTSIYSIDNKLKLPEGQTLENARYIDSFSRAHTINFKKMVADLKTVLMQTDTKLSNRESAFFLRFCEDIYGSKFIRTSSKIVWERKNWSYKLTPKDSEDISIQQMLEHLESDIDLFHRYIGSMSNNPDVIGQIIDKGVKAANKTADDKVITYMKRLNELEDKLKTEYGITDTSFMYERDDDGNLTGNFITPPDPDIMDDNDNMLAVNYGKWEKARYEHRKEFMKEFKERHPNWESMSGFERGMLFNKEYKKAYAEWNEENSIPKEEKDEFGNVISRTWKPNAKYASSQYNDMIHKYRDKKGRVTLQKWLGEMYEIKRELDGLLDPGATHTWRAPQFKGVISTRIANKRASNSFIESTGMSMRESFFETFCESSEDEDYGDNNTFNHPENDLLGVEMDFAKDRPNRVPVFGVNKLKDMTQLSTDVFQSMLAYASMASSYESLSTLVDGLEVGRSALLNRQIDYKGHKREKDLETHTRAYSRFMKYMDKQVYGISSTPMGMNIGKHKWMWNKIWQALTKLASVRFLGGNVLGGAVNTGTGFIEEFKEAASSDEYGLEDLVWAHKRYWACIPSNWTHAGSLQKDDKMSLFIRYFNILGDNREVFKTRHRNKSRIRRLSESAVFLPYSSGDHYMQSMAYLSLAHNTKLVGTKGTRCNLWDAYKREKYIDKKSGVIDRVIDRSKYDLEFRGTKFKNAVGHDGITSEKLRKKEMFLKNEGDLAEYNRLVDLLEKVEKSIQSPLIAFSPTTEELKYIADNKLSIDRLGNIRTHIQNSIYKMLWTADDETKFMDKAREINNRMHGIYNNQDKTAFHGNWYTNAFLAMKGYALGMIERRFSPSHYSIALDTDVEGSIMTMGKVWAGIFAKEVNVNLRLALAATFAAPFVLRNNSKLRTKFIQAGFSSFQISNMKRNAMDLYILIILYLMRFLCAEPPKEDRDEDYEPDQIKGYGYYFATRWLREQEAFNAPWGIWNESTTLMDFVPIGAVVVGDIAKLCTEMGGAAIADEDNSDYFYQRDHPEEKYIEGEPKYINHLLSFIPYVKSWYNIENPYEAIYSYEYGRKLNRR